MTQRKVIAVALVLFFVFAYLRFFNLNNRIIFDWDQEHYAYEIKNIVVEHKLTLIGPRANNDLGFFLGPYFTYLMLPFYLLTNLHPNGSIYFLVAYNLVFYWLSFVVIKKLFNVKTALLFLILWTVNNLLTAYDIIPWWPVLIPLGVILTWKFLLEKKMAAAWIMFRFLYQYPFPICVFDFLFLPFPSPNAKQKKSVVLEKDRFDCPWFLNYTPPAYIF